MAVDGSIFDDVMGPIVISNVSCFGDEFRLSDCANTTDLPDMCSHATDAAVTCQPGLSKGDACILPVLNTMIDEYFLSCSYCHYLCRHGDRIKLHCHL